MQDFIAGIYIRLSREDGDKGVSDSILNQEKLLKNYVEEKEGISFGDCYIDEDYTGINFNRPGFQRMMEDIKSGNINCIIIKDLSRLGRNFIESSRYIEEVFPKYNCRFISVLDNVDSYENPDINTDLLLRLKNLIHDNNSQEISKKVRAVKDMQRHEGKHISPYTPYGYVKDPNNRYKLTIDEKAARIVMKIFEWYINGLGIVRISEKLNRLEVTTLSDYKRQIGQIHNETCCKGGWYPTVVRKILTNKAYIGALDQKRITTRNYKDRNSIRLKEEDHIIVYDTHDPIIEKHVFYTVQEMLKRYGKRTSPNEQNIYLFSGLMRCADCNYTMIRNQTIQNGKKYVYYKCRSYNQRGKSICPTSHSVREEIIYSAVRYQINSHLDNLIDIKKTVDNYNKSRKENSFSLDILKLVDKNQKKIKDIENLKMSIYADYKKEIFSEKEFLNMKESYSKEIEKLEKDILLLKEALENENDEGKNKIPWIEELIKQGKIFTLNREIITKLVDKIYVSADKKINVRFKYEDILNKVAENLYNINPNFVGGIYADSIGK